MPRRGHIARHDVLPDPMYNSKTVTRLINNIMLDGKKGVAQRIVYDAFDIIKEKTGKDPVEVFEEAMKLDLTDVKHSVCAGLHCSQERDPKEQWLNVLLTSLWMPQTAPAARSRRKRILTRWLKRIRHSLTIAGNFYLKNLFPLSAWSISHISI